MKLTTLTVGAIVTLTAALPAFAADRTFQMVAFPDNPAWDEAIKTVTAMAPKGTTVIAMPATGTIHVMNATDATLGEIGKVVNKLNHDAAYTYPVELKVFRNGQYQRTMTFVIASRKAYVEHTGITQEYVSACVNSPAPGSFQKSTLHLGTTLKIALQPASNNTYLAHYMIRQTDLVSLQTPEGATCPQQLPTVDERSTDQVVRLVPDKAFSGSLGGGMTKDQVTYTLTMKVIPPIDGQ